jgi:hypothetical protein
MRQRSGRVKAGYVLWTYIGPESVFFFPPGSVEEHLVVAHGVASLDVRTEVRGHVDHLADHCRQVMVRRGAVGDLLAVPHEQAA